MSAEHRRKSALEAYQRFLGASLDDLLDRHRRQVPEDAAVSHFHSVAESVPAYAAFLEERGIHPVVVRTFPQFRAVPFTNKANYISQHPLAARCRDGRVSRCEMLAASSGSTGSPTFWPRSLADELEVAVRFEQVFHDSFAADRLSTLAIVCFALGAWVGGMYTTDSCRHLAAKGYPITVVSPGNVKDEVLRVFSELASSFDQVVLLGYPPFLKDVVDSGISRGIRWGDYRVRLVTAGEVFSEEWRTLMAERLGTPDILTFSASLYGTADAGVLGNETPLSIAIRRFLAERPEAARALFGESRLPTLVQYDPLSRFFEVKNGTLLFSGDGVAPLVRYHISDEGGLYRCDSLLSRLAEWGFDPFEALRQTSRGMRSLPFVYLFGRSHFTISYFGANIYPENISVGLERPGVREWVTGKFVLESREDDDRNAYLSVTVELAPGVDASNDKEQTIAQSILAELLRLNSEFVAYTPPDRQMPRVSLVQAGHPECFPVGVKHRYTRK